MSWRLEFIFEVEKTLATCLGCSLDYGRIGWQRILKAMEKARDVVYGDVLKGIDKVCCTKALFPLEITQWFFGRLDPRWVS